MATTAIPRILLVEDDPVSCAVLAAAVASMPAQVDTADSLASAHSLASRQRYDLWLFDANLPDGRGEDLLRQLRSTQPGIPAIAHTADSDADTKDALIAAGFSDVFVKPLPGAAVQAAVRAALRKQRAMPAGPHDAPAECAGDWDDAAASRALNGRHEHVAALRMLFVGELPAVFERMATAVHGNDRDSLRAESHRLRASCGFVGAVRLQHALERLDEAPCSPAAWQAFATAARALTSQDEAEVAG